MLDDILERISDFIDYKSDSQAPDQVPQIKQEETRDTEEKVRVNGEPALDEHAAELPSADNSASPREKRIEISSDAAERRKSFTLIKAARTSYGDLPRSEPTDGALPAGALETHSLPTLDSQVALPADESAQMLELKLRMRAFSMSTRPLLILGTAMYRLR